MRRERSVRTMRRHLLLLAVVLISTVAALLPASPAFAVTPTVSSFSPVQGVQGTLVTVTGSGFTGATAVKFNGVAGTGLTVVSDTSVKATVPAGATTGPISVTTPGGTGTSSTSFKVLPKITGFTPTNGPEATLVTVTGTGLTNPTAVKLNGSPAEFTRGSNTSLTFTVPAGATSGPITVTTAGGTASSPTSFTVTAPRPTLTLNRRVGPPTTKVTVTGSHFAPFEAVDIYADTTDVKLVSTDGAGGFSATGVVVPASTPPGTLWFTAIGRKSGFAAQVSFVVRTDWRMYRAGPLGRGVNAYENVLGAATIGDVERDWTTTRISFANVPGGAVVSGGLTVAPVAYESRVVALRSDGSEVWSRPQTLPFFNGQTPAVAGSTVVIGDADGRLHAYNLTTGAARWTTSGPGDVSGRGSPVIVGGAVYAPGADALQAFDLVTGALLWRYQGPCTSSVSTPAISGGIIAFTCRYTSADGTSTSDYEVYVDTNGSFLRYAGGPGAGSTGAPTYVAGALLALVHGELRLTGDLGYNSHWSVTLPSGGYYDPVAGMGLAVVCGDAGTYAYALGSGRGAWGDSSVRCTAPPALANGLVYVPESNGIAVLDKSGNVLARLGAPGNLGSLAVSDGAVYAAVGITGVARWAIPEASTSATPPSTLLLRPDRTLRAS